MKTTIEIEKMKHQRAKELNEIRIKKLELQELELKRKQNEKDEKNKNKQSSQKEAELESLRNHREVEQYVDYLQKIQSIHKKAIKPIDWHSILLEKAPMKISSEDEKKLWENIKEKKQNLILNKINELEFVRKKQIEEREQNKLKQQNLFNKALAWFSKSDKIQQQAEELEDKDYQVNVKRLTDEYEIIKEEDTVFFNALKERQEQKYMDWLVMNIIAKEFLNKNAEHYIKGLNYLDCFSDIKEYGSSIEFKPQKNLLEVDFYPKSEKIVPIVQKEIGAKNNVIETNMPKTLANQIYQDYICSCILHIARETFAILPIDKTLIHVYSNILDYSTGNYYTQCIISVLIEKKDLENLNFNLLDPSDSMKNFYHNMIFDKKEGFTVVQKIIS